MSEHAAEQDVVTAALAPPTAAPTGAVPSAAPRGAGGVAAAIGNHAFGTQYGGGATLGPSGGGQFAQAAQVLARAMFADPASATRAPWASLRDETEQSLVNFS